VRRAATACPSRGGRVRLGRGCAARPLVGASGTVSGRSPGLYSPALRRVEGSLRLVL
jgi:hypothetical protein